MTRGGRAGFTLLEMLLAITLLGLIVGSIIGGLHLGRRAWETGASYDAAGEVEEAARALAGQLQRVYPVQASSGRNSVIVAFQGDASSCRFVALSEGGAQWGGLILTEIGDAGASHGENLSIWTQVFRAADWASGGRGGMQEVSLLQNAAYLRFSYFGEVERGKPPVWTDSWVDRDSLPLLIAVRLAGNRVGRVVDASFTVALKQR